MNNRQDTPHAFPIKHHRVSPAKAAIVALSLFLGLVFVIYAGVALYFTGRFMPNTSACGINFSLMTIRDSEQKLNEKLRDYTLEISGQEFDLTVNATDAGLSVNTSEVIRAMRDDMNPWLWPIQISKGHDESDKLVTESNDPILHDTIQNAVERFNKNRRETSNADISYDAAANTFVVVSESLGTQLDAEAVYNTAQDALSTLSRHATLTAAHLKQPSVVASDPRFQDAIEKANDLLSTDITLTLDSNPVGKIDVALVGSWITVDEKVRIALDKTMLTEWIDKLADEVDTLGKARTYIRPDHKKITVKGGVYGWEIDRDALCDRIVEQIDAGNITEAIEIPTLNSGTTYSAPHQQDWDKRYLDIDLAEQHARLYDDSATLIWESDIISGAPDGEHDTPDGVYYLNRKESPSTLEGYSGDTKIYETEVQYWMPFVEGTIGLHDAEWQPDFGGELYASGLGSHGCVNLPPAKAAELYALIREGDVVVCHW